jgi:hypothetical protein
MNAGQAPKFERSSLSGLDFGSPLESFFLHSPQIPGPGLIWGSAGVALIGPFFFVSTSTYLLFQTIVRNVLRAPLDLKR